MENINELRKEYKEIDLFCTLAEIPSPSLHEDNVIKKILEIFAASNIKAWTDNYGNVRAEIPASDKTKKQIGRASCRERV